MTTQKQITPTPTTPLLPCLFCGDKFEIDKSDPHLFKIRLGDAHGNCPIDENIEFSSEAQLIEYMNKRAAPAAPSLPLAELARLEALEMKATPGEWQFDPENSGVNALPGYGLLVDDSPLYITIHTQRSTGFSTQEINKSAEANAALIAALRNAFPSLAATIRAQDEMIKALKISQDLMGDALKENNREMNEANRLLSDAGIDSNGAEGHGKRQTLDLPQRVAIALAAQAERVLALTEAVETLDGACRGGAYQSPCEDGCDESTCPQLIYNRIQSLVGGAGTAEKAKEQS